MLQLHNLHKSFAGMKVVDGVDLTLNPGTTTILIGPSGCGKSTLLRLMLGLISPDEGRVLFGGESLTKAAILQIRRRIGYVIQDGGLFPHLTAEANVPLMAKRLKWEPDRLHRRLDDLVELTKFPRDGLARYPVELSGGQRQRVALMRALMLNPDVLLLDEPLGALDPMVRFDLQTDLRSIFNNLGKTTVMVTHDLGEAAYFGGRIALMHQGQIVQIDSFQNLLDKPADDFVTRFFTAQRGYTADTPKL
jgi:osmoprotectant transport system ATP-binding protein